MRRLVGVISVVALITVTAAHASSSPSAASVLIRSADVPEFVNSYWSGYCGFEVRMHARGTRFITVVTQNGKVTSEFEFQPHTIWTWTAPSKGTHFDSLAVFSWVMQFPGGAATGGPANVTFVGRNGQIPGLPPDSGTRTYKSTVAGFEGPIPLWAGVFDPSTTLISTTGNWNEQSAVDAAVCKALS